MRLKALSLITVIFMATSFTAYKAAAQEGMDNTYFAAHPMTITLDGDFSDWTGVEYIEVVDGPQTPANPQDGTMRFAVVADNQNLYISALVADAHIVAGKNDEQYWNEDSIEIYINATGNLGLTSYVPGVSQINIPAANIGLDNGQPILTGINWENIGVRAHVVETADGYAVEAAVPLVTDVWNIVPAPETTIGFQVQLNSATQQDRDVKVSWSALDKTADVSYQNPSVFGQLKFVASSNQPAPTTAVEPTAVEAANGSFEVRGSVIVDPQGNEFIAKGVNVSGYNWVWTRKTVNDVDLIANCWNFNLVRVNSFLFTGQVPYTQYDVNNNLDEIVNAFTERGIIVVFEAHDRIGSYYEGDDLTTLVAWFTDLANRYKNNPYVWFDVMNEPGGRYLVDERNWLLVHREVIHAIREIAGANNIIIVEGAHGGQDATGWTESMVQDVNSAILNLADEVMSFYDQTYENIVFSIHPYDQWNYGDAKMADFFDRVIARDLALIVGEYGVQTNVETSRAVESLFNTAVPRRIGRIVWHWDGGDDNDLTVNTSQGGGWEINDCANPTNLSWLGQKVWDDNHAQ